jgi:protein-tyrosine phosphatase
MFSLGSDIHPFAGRLRLLEAGYGGKRAFLRHLRARTQFSLGCFRPFQQIDWLRVRRLVFVCSGNICRSPYAEARARASRIEAASFGLAAASASPADPVAIRVASARGLDLSGHRAATMAEIRLGSRDLIVAMEPTHGLRLLAEPAHWQVTLLGLWASPRRPYLADPFGLDVAYFQTCFSLIDNMIEGLHKNIRPEYRGNNGKSG